jgi:hypothetical protein
VKKSAVCSTSVIRFCCYFGSKLVTAVDTARALLAGRLEIHEYQRQSRNHPEKSLFSLQSRRAHPGAPTDWIWIMQMARSIRWHRATAAPISVLLSGLLLSITSAAALDCTSFQQAEVDAGFDWQAADQDATRANNQAAAALLQVPAAQQALKQCLQTINAASVRAADKAPHALPRPQTSRICRAK